MNRTSYIAGFFDAKGCFERDTITITNTELYLLQNISKALSKIGIKNKITERKLKNSKHKKAYDIKIYHRSNIDKFYTYIPIMHRQKRHNILKYIVDSKYVIKEGAFANIKRLR